STPIARHAQRWALPSRWKRVSAAHIYRRTTTERTSPPRAPLHAAGAELSSCNVVRGGAPLRTAAIAHEIRVVGQLGDLPPQILIVAEGEAALPSFLKTGMGFGPFREAGGRRAQRRLHAGLGEGPQLPPRRHQPLERGRIARIIFCLHPLVGHCGFHLSRLMKL